MATLTNAQLTTEVTKLKSQLSTITVQISNLIKTTDQLNQTIKSLPEIPTFDIRAVQYLNGIELEQKYPLWNVTICYIVHNELGVIMAVDPANPAQYLYDSFGLEMLPDKITFQNGIKAAVPENYVGPAMFDEENALEAAAYGLATDVKTQTAIARLKQKIQWANEVRPNALWGYYGMPARAVYDKDGYANLTNVAILDKQYVELAKQIGVKAFYPSMYDVVYGQPIWTDKYEQDVNRICLENQLNNGFPVYPFLWKRYHDNGNMLNGLGLTLVHPQEFSSTLYTIAHTSIDDKYAKGVIIWGSEEDYIRKLGEQMAIPEETSPYYWIILRSRSVLKAGKLPNQTTDEYINSTEEYYLNLTAHMLNDFPLFVNFPANLGPVITEIPSPPIPIPQDGTRIDNTKK